MVGQQLKQFTVERILGQGGMGVVYRALDTKLQRPVALKLLSGELMSDPEKRRRFLTEARAAARITHPAIAQVYDVDEADGMIFIAMELVDGKTVRDLIHDKELDLLGSIDIAIQVAEGLARAHEAGIIHRDIKPANVMLTRDNHAKILDFGLAKLMESSVQPALTAPNTADLETLTQTQPGAVLGTAAYMSPEQVRGTAVDARTDIFALGVMLFEMATWQLPFRRESPIETMHAILTDETPPLGSFRTNLPPDLQRIVTRCLRKRPEDRYPDARALVADLQVLRRQTESGQTLVDSLTGRVPAWLDRIRQWAPSHTMWLVLAGVLTLGLLIVLFERLIGGASLFFWGLIALLVWRHFRNRPERLVDKFVRRARRIPEIQVIASEQLKVTVVVERPVGQLYGRLHDALNAVNRDMFFGPPLTLNIRHGLSEEELHQFLAGTGIRHVRDDVGRAD